MGFKTKLFLAVVGLSFALAQVSLAEELQERQAGVFDLGQVVVTATKTERRVEDAPGSVTVVSREEIERRNIKTVDEALSELKGIFVKRNKGLMDAVPAVRMRGFPANRYVLILLDGQPLNDGYTGTLEWGMMPVDNIERIEVIRGPWSALYGGNAMGGVINIITKTPEKLDVSVTGGGGTNNTRRYRFSVGNRFADKLSLRIGYEEESTDGYVTRPVLRRITAGTGTESGGYAMSDQFGDPTMWVVGNTGNNYAERSSFDAKATFDFSDTGRLSFTAVSGQHEYGYGPPNTYMGTFTGSAIAGAGKKASFNPNNFISGTGIGRHETDIYTLSFKELFGPVQLNAQVGTTRTDARHTRETGGRTKTWYDSPGMLRITEAETWFSEVRTDVPIGEAHLLTLGVSYRTDESDTNEYDIPYYRSYAGKSDSTHYSGGRSRNWGLFVQNEWSITESLRLYLGGRYDAWKVYDGASGVPGSETKYDSRRDSEFSPRAGLVWKALPDTTLRASVGHAFRPPNLFELYRTWTWGEWEWRGNPNLGPETVWGYEAGVNQYFFGRNGRKTRLSLTGYYNDIEDLIYNKIDDIAKTRTRMNAGRARTYGLEFEVSQEITRWLKAWGNFTHTNARITDNPLDPETEGKRIRGIPETMYNIGLEAKHKGFKGSLVARYVSKIYTRSDNRDTAEGVFRTYEPTFLVDAKVAFTPFEWGEISLSVDNIFDEEYFTFNIAPGRTFLLETKLKF